MRLKEINQNTYSNFYKANSEYLNMKCISCNKETSKIVKFPCPGCKEELLRCDKCRSLSIESKTDYHIWT